MSDQICVKSPSDPAGFVVEELKVRTGQWINKGQTLFVLRPLKEIPGKSLKASLVRVKAEDSGKVKTVGVKRKQEVTGGMDLASISNQECSHPTVMKNMCADCGLDLQKDMPATGFYPGATGGRAGVGVTQPAPDASASIAVLHSIPELKVSNDEAVSLGREDERRLLQSRRLVLLVDLDQTLIHTTNEDIPPNLKNVHHFQLHGSKSPWYHTRMRPRTAEFLENISKLYELHIVTFGARLYAHTIAKFLDKDSKYFSHRILSRDECFDNKSKTANLSSLFPCGDHMVCIIDDREDVWNYAPNLVHVKPYIFFKNTGDINAPPGSAKVPMPPADAASKTVKMKDTIKKSVEPCPVPSAPAATSQPPSAPPPNVDRRDSIDMPTFDDMATTEAVPSSDGDKKPVTDDDATSAVSVDLELSDEEDSNQSGGGNKDVLEDSKKEDKDSSSSSSSGSSQSSEKSTAAEDKEKKKEAEKEEGEEEDKKEEAVEDDLMEIEDTDDYLLYLEDTLKAIHKAYYGLFDQLKSQAESAAGQLTSASDNVPDLKQVIPGVKRKALRGSSIVFSGVVPTHVRLERSKPFLVARSLGAKVTDKIGDDTTHLVAARLGTAKVNQVRSKKLESRIHLVTPNWLWDCAERWEKVDERLYSLCKSNVTVTVVDPPAHCSSPEDNAADRSPDLPPELAAAASTSSGQPLQRQISEESLNPFLAFSSEDLKGMDKEVEDILSNDSSSSDSDSAADGEDKESSDEEEEEEGGPFAAASASTKQRQGAAAPVVQSLSESSSSDDSMTGELPRGMKRKATEQDTGGPDNRGEDEQDEDDEPLDRFKRGATVDDSMGFDVANASDDEDDDEMAAQLEREFLGDSDSNF